MNIAIKANVISWPYPKKCNVHSIVVAIDSASMCSDSGVISVMALAIVKITAVVKNNFWAKYVPSTGIVINITIM